MAQAQKYLGVPYGKRCVVAHHCWLTPQCGSGWSSSLCFGVPHTAEEAGAGIMRRTRVTARAAPRATVRPNATRSHAAPKGAEPR